VLNNTVEGAFSTIEFLMKNAGISDSDKEFLGLLKSCSTDREFIEMLTGRVSASGVKSEYQEGLIERVRQAGIFLNCDVLSYLMYILLGFSGLDMCYNMVRDNDLRQSDSKNAIRIAKTMLSPDDARKRPPSVTFIGNNLLQMAFFEAELTLQSEQGSLL